MGGGGDADEGGNDPAVVPGTHDHEGRGDDLLAMEGGSKDDRDHVNGKEEEGEENENEESLNDDESTIVEKRGEEDGGGEQSSRRRPGEENLDVLASMASRKLKESQERNLSVGDEDGDYKVKELPDTLVGKGGARHHLLRHTLDPNKTGENAVKFFHGAKNVEEALAIASTMSQKELQKTFGKVYGVSSSSNNNNWLRKKLMEALAPKMWRDAWDRYMDEPFSNRGKKDRLRKEREAQEMREKSGKIAKYGTFDHVRPVAAQHEATAGLARQGMDGGRYLMVPSDNANAMQHQMHPNEMYISSGGYQVQESQKELVQALNTVSNLLVQYMNGHRYPPSQPGGFAPYHQHQNQYADSMYNTNSSHYGPGMYAQNYLYNNVPYSGFPAGHIPSMPYGNSSHHLDGLNNVDNLKNERDSRAKEQVIFMLKQLVNKRAEEEEQAANMNEFNQKQKVASLDDQKEVSTKGQDLADAEEHNVFQNLVKKLRNPSSNGSPTKENSQQDGKADEKAEAETQIQFFGSPLHNEHTIDGVGQVKENTNQFGPLPGSTFPADKMMRELLQQWLKDR